MSREYTRFTVNQRLQHIFMFVPFIILVLTGFPIKFPDSKFWEVILAGVGGIESARMIHRVAAAVMILDFAFHVIYKYLHLYCNESFLVWGACSRSTENRYPSGTIDLDDR